MPAVVLNEDRGASGLGEAIKGGRDVGGLWDDERWGDLVLVAESGADEVEEVLRPADTGIMQVGHSDCGSYLCVKHVVVGLWNVFV